MNLIYSEALKKIGCFSIKHKSLINSIFVIGGTAINGILLVKALERISVKLENKDNVTLDELVEVAISECKYLGIGVAATFVISVAFNSFCSYSTNITAQQVEQFMDAMDAINLKNVKNKDVKFASKAAKYICKLQIKHMFKKTVKKAKKKFKKKDINVDDVPTMSLKDLEDDSISLKEFINGNKDKVVIFVKN